MCAAGSAFSYAVTIVLGRRLASAGFSSSISLGIRFAIAALLLIGAVVVTRRPLLPAPGERVAAVLLGGVGYAIQSSFFFIALSHGTAAAVALLFYAYPAIVTLVAIPLTGSKPSRRGVVALALSVSGTALIAAASGEVDISTAGIGFALAAAASFAAYLLAGEHFLVRTDSLTSGAYVAAGAALSLLTIAALNSASRVPGGREAELIAYGVATAVAFVLLFAAVRRIGSARTAVVLTLEAFFAIVLAAIFLDEAIGPVQVVGGAAILAGACIVSLAPQDRPRAP